MQHASMFRGKTANKNSPSILKKQRTNYSKFNGKNKGKKTEKLPQVY